jgi:glycosyltransferase involved in cell wall biosynthesis
VKVFLAGTSFRPEYGGPAYSVSRLAAALAGAGAEVGLWAPDQSAEVTPLLSTTCSVRRIGGTEADALNGFGSPDILHDNGIWLRHNHRLAELAKRQGIPRIVSTRGMLEPWALKHKKWKKTIAWSVYQRRDLASANCHHATAESEASNIRGLGLDVPVCMIPNGVDLPETTDISTRPGPDRTGKTALFIGRIYPIKGLPMLIEAWAQARPSGWKLHIAGPDEAGHRLQVEHAISAAGLDEIVSFLGPLEGRAKQAAFSDADLFVLPTHSESFGIAVAEALAYKLPVLTTTAAPWPMLRDRDCGWCVDPSVSGLTKGLRQATSCDSATLRAMGERGRAFVAKDFGWARIATQFVEIYEALLREKPPAPCSWHVISTKTDQGRAPHSN